MNHSVHEKGRKPTAPLPRAAPEQAQPESCPTSCFHSMDALLDDAEADAVQLGSCRGREESRGEQLAGQGPAGSTRLLLNPCHPSNAAPLPGRAGDK